MPVVPSEHQPQKLTNWANEPDLLRLKQDFEMAKPAHDAQVRRIDEWTKLMKADGPPKTKGRSSVQPKLIRRQAEWRYSALTEPFLGSNKLFKVSPVSWEDTEGAVQNELVLNWQFRTKLNRIKFIDDFVRSNVDEGTCILRVGWCRTTVKIKQKVPVYQHFQIQDEQQLAQFQEALQLREEDPQTYHSKVPANIQAAVDFYDESGQPTYAVQSGFETQTVDKVVENHPTVEVTDPRNFYLDPTCNGDPTKALFAIVSFETNQAELKKNPERYKNLDKVNWETSTPITEPDHATMTGDASQQFRDLLRKRVVAYEYWGLWDINGDGVLVPIVCTWIGNTIIRMERNPFPDQKSPFIIVPYLPVKRNVYGEPDAELLADNQAILGAVTRGMIDLLGRSANAQRGMAKGMLDALNRRRYENGQDYEFNPNQNPQNHIVEHKFPELPASALQMVNLQNAEAEALTGVKSFGGGISGEAYGDVAAGIKGVLDAAAKREMAILRRLAKAMAEVGMKFISMNTAFMSQEEIVRVTNNQFVELSPAQQNSIPNMGHNGGPPLDDGEDRFVKVNREDLAGNFDLEVDISTAEVDNAKSQDLAFMLQTLGPKGDQGMVMMILSEIAELKRMPALAHKIRTYKPQPTPEEQQMQQLALEKAKLEVEELKSQIALNRARAAEAGASKDLKDLQYVETETGTTHARNLDLQGAQARANQDLSVTKALLTPKKEGEKSGDIEAAIGYNELSDMKHHVNTLGVPASAAPPVASVSPVPVDTSTENTPVQLGSPEQALA